MTNKVDNNHIPNTQQVTLENPKNLVPTPKPIEESSRISLKEKLISNLNSWASREETQETKKYFRNQVVYFLPYHLKSQASKIKILANHSFSGVIKRCFQWIGLRFLASLMQNIFCPILSLYLSDKDFSDLKNLSNLSVNLHQTFFPELKSQILPQLKNHPKKKCIKKSLNNLEKSETIFDLIYGYRDLLELVVPKEDKKQIKKIDSHITELRSQKGVEKLKTFSKILNTLSTLTLTKTKPSFQKDLKEVAHIIDEGLDFIEKLKNDPCLKTQGKQFRNIETQIQEIQKETSLSKQLPQFLTLLKQFQTLKIPKNEDINRFINKVQPKLTNLKTKYPQIASLIDSEIVSSNTQTLLSVKTNTCIKINNFHEKIAIQIETQLQNASNLKKIKEHSRFKASREKIQKIKIHLRKREEQQTTLEKIKWTEELLKQVNALELPNMGELKQMTSFVQKELKKLHPLVEKMVTISESITSKESQEKFELEIQLLKANDQIQDVLCGLNIASKIGKALLTLSPYILNSTGHILEEISHAKKNVEKNALISNLKNKFTSIHKTLTELSSKNLTLLDKLSLVKKILEQIQNLETKDSNDLDQNVQEIQSLLKTQINSIQEVVVKELDRYSSSLAQSLHQKAENLKGLFNIDLTEGIEIGHQIGDNALGQIKKKSKPLLTSLEAVDKIHKKVKCLHSSETSFREKIQAADDLLTLIEDYLLQSKQKALHPLIGEALETILDMTSKIHSVNGHLNTLADPSFSLEKLKSKVNVVQKILIKAANTVDSMQTTIQNQETKNKIVNVAHQLKESAARIERVRHTLDNWAFKFVYNGIYGLANTFS